MDSYVLEVLRERAYLRPSQGMMNFPRHLPRLQQQRHGLLSSTEKLGHGDAMCSKT